jgi:hypothetical protein
MEQAAEPNEIESSVDNTEELRIAEEREHRKSIEWLKYLGFDSSMSQNALMTRNKMQAFEHLCTTNLKSTVKVWETPLRVHIGISSYFLYPLAIRC